MIVGVVALLVAGVVASCGGSVFSLEVGECFNDPDDTELVSNVSIVDCVEPHNNEVFHLFDIAGDDFPGEATLSDLAASGCRDAFDDYVGFAYADSDFEIFRLTPSEDSWDDGDREVVCSLFDLTSQRWTGTARNSGR